MEISPMKHRGKICLNCSHPLGLDNRFCPNCGQKNSVKRLSLGDFSREFLSNFYAYDSKVNRTVRSLLFQPGKAALEFINGRRQSLANPFRFYLSISLLFFLIAALSSKWHSFDLNQIPRESELENLIEVKTDSLQNNANNREEAIKFSSDNKLSRMSDLYEQHPEWTYEQALDHLGYPKTRWNAYCYKKTADMYHLMESRKGKGSGLEAFAKILRDNLPLILFLSLPLITLVFSLFYLQHHYRYAEHLAMVFYTMSFVFLWLLLMKGLNWLTGWDTSVLTVLALPPYLYKTLRNFYRETRWVTIFKFVFLTAFLSIATAFTGILVILVAFLIF